MNCVIILIILQLIRGPVSVLSDFTDFREKSVPNGTLKATTSSIFYTPGDMYSIVRREKIRRVLRSPITDNSAAEKSTTAFSSQATETRTADKGSMYLPTETTPVVFTDEAEYESVPKFYVDINNCGKDKVIHFEGTEGMIHGFTNRNTFNKTNQLCFFHVTVPSGLFVKAHSKIAGHGSGCSGSTQMAANDRLLFDITITRLSGLWNCGFKNSNGESPLLLMPGNELYVAVYDEEGNATDFWLYFKGVGVDMRETLNLVSETHTSGYITSRGFDENLCSPWRLNVSHNLHLPENHVLMITFTLIDLNDDSDTFVLDGSCANSLAFYSAKIGTYFKQLWKVCFKSFLEPQIYNTSLLIKFTSGNFHYSKGFKMRFSFHPVAETPVKLESGLFDCSRHYTAFQQHLDCNLRQECEGGEDETEHCPFSSAQCAGDFHFKNKCIGYEGFHPGEEQTTWNRARDICHSKNSDLATFPTLDELDSVKVMFDLGLRGTCAYIGLKLSNGSVPDMYRETFRWIDGTTAYYPNISYPEYVNTMNQEDCMFIDNKHPRVFTPFNCAAYSCKSFFCEKKISTDKPLPRLLVNFPVNDNDSETLSHDRLSLVRCPDEHVTHDFLLCDLDSHCAAKRHASRCDTVPQRSFEAGVTEMVSVGMFACHEGGGTVPYTLLCDFRPDCGDGSDEKYCKYIIYSTKFRCCSEQFVEHDRQCNIIKDCFDGTDEMNCPVLFTSLVRRFTKRPPVIINLDERGTFTQVQMESDTAPCPVTHFSCPGQSVYCLPLYLRCNGVKDCPGGEDELSCAHFTCPGFYRCRGSSVCLHASHLCDGWPQCPQRDDELFCNNTCPNVCQCQGLAFVCPQPFPADHFPDLRYLDAEGSGIAPSSLLENVYLIYLSLADCNMTVWPGYFFQNLQHLDLSGNKLRTLDMNSFALLPTLHSLRLRSNPLTSLILENTSIKQHMLITIDLAFTHLRDFHSESLACFPALQSLNLSHSNLHTISEDGFKWQLSLTHVDLTGCEVETYPRDVFAALQNLSVVYASNYKLCCKATLPEKFNHKFCFAPQDEVSSCDNLLRSNHYRVFLWFISILALFGNAGCLLFRLYFQRGTITKSGYNMFVANLTLADFVMGLYLAIVGTADQLYRSNYWWYEQIWKSSVMCWVAGFLSLLSSEVSAFMICLITLDRFIVLRFPFSSVRFKGRSAVVAAGLAWLVGVLLAAVPLMPSLSHWRFYSQTGICIPLPVTRNSFQGQGYSFGVMIVFNFILFVAIACGQAVIYWSIRANSMARQDTTNASRDLTVARRLITVVVSDFLCWFPIGMLGLMAFNGVAVPGEVNVAMAIFVLPLNSALNPFLYTLNIVIERRQRLKEDRLRKLLLTHASAQQHGIA